MPERRSPHPPDGPRERDAAVHRVGRAKAAVAAVAVLGTVLFGTMAAANGGTHAATTVPAGASATPSNTFGLSSSSATSTDDSTSSQASVPSSSSSSAVTSSGGS
jgi:hypothetical protein